MKPFLRKLLEHSLYTAMTAFIFMIFFIIGVIVWEAFNLKRVSQPFVEKIEYVGDWDILAKEFEVSKLEMLQDFKPLTIKGTIKNNSTQKYWAIDVMLEYYIEDVKMGKCDHYDDELNSLDPMESQGFIVKCKDLMLTKLPTGFNYKVFVRSANRFKDDTKTE